jgi:hypothetical protein
MAHPSTLPAYTRRSFTRAVRTVGAVREPPLPFPQNKHVRPRMTMKYGGVCSVRIPLLHAPRLHQAVFHQGGSHGSSSSTVVGAVREPPLPFPQNKRVCPCTTMKYGGVCSVRIPLLHAPRLLQARADQIDHRLIDRLALACGQAEHIKHHLVQRPSVRLVDFVNRTTLPPLGRCRWHAHSRDPDATAEGCTRCICGLPRGRLRCG